MRRACRAAALGLFAAAALAGPVRAADGQIAALAREDRETVAAVEAALNAIRTLSARFVQTSSNGAVARGTLVLARPGNLRIDYAPPAAMRLIARDGWLMHIDTELENITYIPLSRTPADVLVRERISLEGDIVVTGVERGRGVVRLGLVRRGAEDEGRLALVFSEPGLALRQWVVTDAQGIETRVTLYETAVNRPVDPKVFDFDPSRYDHTSFE